MKDSGKRRKHFRIVHGNGSGIDLQTKDQGIIATNH
jgi:hypothetical protein